MLKKDRLFMCKCVCVLYTGIDKKNVHSGISKIILYNEKSVRMIFTVVYKTIKKT